MLTATAAEAEADGVTGPVHPRDCGELDACRLAIKAFGEVAGRLGEMRALDDVLRLLATRMATLVRVQRCSVYLRDDRTGLYRGQVAHGADDALIKRLIGGIEADGFTRAIVSSRAPIVLDDALRDPRAVTSALRSLHVRSVMGVPMIADGEVLGIFFLDHENRTHQFTQAEREIAFAFADLAAAATVQARLLTALRTSLETVARQNGALRRANMVEDHLTRLVFESADIPEIARTLAQLTSKPCAIYDHEHRLVALEMPPGSEQLVAAPDLRALAESDHADALSAFRGAQDKRTAIVAPQPTLGLSRRLLLASVMARDERCGTVALIEYPRRFEHFDLLICRRAASIVALELTAGTRHGAAAGPQLVGALDERSNRALRCHLVESRLRIPGAAVSCLLAPLGAGSAAVAAETILAAIADTAPDVQALATDLDDGLLLTLGVTAARAVELLDPICRDRDGRELLLAGVSRDRVAHDERLRACREARQALRCAQAHHQAGGRLVWSADELGPARVFLADVDPVEVQQLCDELLGDLLSRSTANDSVLQTLAVFFDHGSNVRETAATLDVHQNTVRYRLARAEEVLGRDRWNCADVRLSIQMCLLALRLQGRL